MLTFDRHEKFLTKNPPTHESGERNFEAANGGSRSFHFKLLYYAFLSDLINS